MSPETELPDASGAAQPPDGAAPPKEVSQDVAASPEDAAPTAEAGTDQPATEAPGASAAVPEDTLPAAVQTTVPDSSPRKTDSGTPGRPPWKHLSEFPEILQVALIYFSAVSLGLLEFFKNAFPRRDIVLPDKSGVVWAIVVVLVLPTLVLITVDRLLAVWKPDGHWNRWFRTVVFAVMLVLLLRQLEVYSGAGKDFAGSVRETDGLIYLVSFLAVAGVTAACVFALRWVTTFFYYMSPIAVAMVGIIPFQLATSEGLPDGYLREVTTVDPQNARDPLFVFVFDEMSFDQITNEDGLIDPQRFPNMAALAGEGAWFTNATSNYFWSGLSIPSISLPITNLNDQYNVRMYSQYQEVEKEYAAGCGQTWTCRGVAYLTDQRPVFLSANIGLRMVYNITPKRVENMIDAPMGVVVNDVLGVSYPSRDDWGFHIFTKKQFQTFMDDVSAGESPGSAYFVHVFLPHHPHVFEPDGTAKSDVLAPTGEESQTIQSEYADRLVGEFVAKLKREGLYDRATIILTSDHGYRGPFPGADYQLKHHTTQVPLIIRAPGIEPRVSDIDYQHIDFAATLNDVLNLPPPDGTDGVSAFAEQRPERDKVFHVNEMVFRYDRNTGEWVRAPETASAAGGPVAGPTIQE